MSAAHTLKRTVAAVAAVASLVVLTGCSASHSKDADKPGVGSGAQLGPGEGEESPSPAGAGTSPGSGATPSPSSTGSSGAVPDPQSLASWPAEPVDATKVPDFRSQVIKPGYTGESYLDHLAVTWGITLEARQKIDFPGRPTVWHTSGVKQSGETKTAIAAVWSLDGDLMSVSCLVTAAAPRRADFLHDCASMSHPGAAPAAAKAWLDEVEPRVDATFASGKGTAVDSPLHRAGPVATVLQKSRDASYGGDRYELYAFGTGSN
ncbi:hypothetical protein OG689_07460 [Kitasatospora sp. NBC_00240]|uniref:hypothetical protein n=1 Tax=Kitasatospora sp. NBC_00240 TaxID=2903567 RepID=UPI00225742DD|nr:hypothetical protein [Kitasatospora sp. NBC_00240]MCX5209123.1 hypothetical protein [Kitasatospora sp. NBC_00240]